MAGLEHLPLVKIWNNLNQTVEFHTILQPSFSIFFFFVLSFFKFFNIFITVFTSNFFSLFLRYNWLFICLIKLHSSLFYLINLFGFPTTSDFPAYWIFFFFTLSTFFCSLLGVNFPYCACAKGIAYRGLLASNEAGCMYVWRTSITCSTYTTRRHFNDSVVQHPRGKRSPGSPCKVWNIWQASYFPVACPWSYKHQNPFLI